MSEGRRQLVDPDKIPDVSLVNYELYDGEARGSRSQILTEPSLVRGTSCAS